MLAGDETLCPVRTRTQVIESEALTFKTSEEKDKRLAKDTRIVLQVGRTGYSSVITRREYINGVLTGEPVVTEESLPPVDEKLLVGSYSSSSESKRSVP